MDDLTEIKKEISELKTEVSDLKERFYHFIDNDFHHMAIKLERHDVLLWLVVSLLGVILARAFGVF